MIPSLTISRQYANVKVPGEQRPTDIAERRKALGQTDKQFGGFLRMLIARLKLVMMEKDPAAKNALLQDILTDLQNTLED